MENISQSQNLINIKRFFNLDKTIYITFGEKGIGKSAFLLSQLQKYASKSTKVLHIQSDSFSHMEPLNSIYRALHKLSVVPYSELLKELCATEDVIYYIENPHLLLPDDQAILSEAIRFILHSKNSKTFRLRIFLEFDGDTRCACFLDSLMTSRNTYLAPFEKLDSANFCGILRTHVSASDQVIKLISSQSKQNFLKADEILLLLLEYGLATYEDNGNIKCFEVTVSDIKRCKENTVWEHYTCLDETLKPVIRYSALMGPTIVSAMLHSPLNVLSPDKELEKIEKKTGWVVKEKTSNYWKILFQDTSVYFFEDEITLNKIRNYSSTEEKDDVYARLARHLELRYQNLLDKDQLLYVAGTILSTIGYYYERYDLKKAIEYHLKAGECFSHHKMLLSAAEHYEYCFRNTNKPCDKTQYFYLLLQSLIDAEQNHKALELLKEKSITQQPFLLDDSKIKFLQAVALYNIGSPDECLNILISVEKKLPYFKKDYFSFQVYSLLSSVYDWENDVRNRRKYFRKALDIQKKLQDKEKELAFCHIYKKANMVLNFAIPEIQSLMKKAMENYYKLGLHKEAFECAHNIGLAYLYLCDFEQSHLYLKKSLDGFNNISSLEKYVPLNSIGILSMLKENYEQAMHYFDCINIDAIEPFCAYSVLINKAICQIRLMKSIPAINETFSLLDKLEKTAGLKMELRIPYVNLQIAKAFFELREKNLEAAHPLLRRAILFCDEKNDNFTLPGVICSRVLQDQFEKDIITSNNPYLYANNSLGKLCEKRRIVICDFLFWA